MTNSAITFFFRNRWFFFFWLFSFSQQLLAQECVDWESSHPEWIFCDDFESADPLVGEGRYFEYTDNAGDFKLADAAGLQGSRGMEVVFQQGEVDAGSLKLAFGRNPQSYMDKGIRSSEDFREIFYRMYLKMEDGWVGSPAKLSRATVFNSGEVWSQAMIAHLWSGSEEELLLDPASCVNGNDQVVCTTYNDFDNLDWLGIQRGTTRIFSTENSGRWFCVEHQVRLNDPGQSNGLQEFWIDENPEAVAEDLNYVGSWTDYGINAVFFENYWNEGSAQDQKRYFDNIVVSTEKIGCLADNAGLLPPQGNPGTLFRENLIFPIAGFTPSFLRSRDFPQLKHKKVRVILSALDGQEVWSENWDVTGEVDLEINLQAEPRGIYLVRFSPVK